MTKKSPNRIAMVTGVGRRKGIGAAIAHTLAEAGAHIVSLCETFHSVMHNNSDCNSF